MKGLGCSDSAAGETKASVDADGGKVRSFSEAFQSRFDHLANALSGITSSTQGGRGRSTSLSTNSHPSTVSRFQDLNTSIVSLETLMDTFFSVFLDCKATMNQSEHMASFLSKYDKFVTKMQTLRVNTQDFDVMKTLATGAIGKVCLVRGKSDQQLYAMKVLKKLDLLTRREASFFMEERNALVFAQDSRWITKLYAAFQDEEQLYLIMEYASGGSLRTRIDSTEEPMQETEARFYIAELILGLEELHNYGYIHRDIKPENCLITESGHLKLADFGSCIRMGDSNKVTCHETVGTPDYISPEILRAHEGKTSYGREVDLWSLGIILYELLFDEVPFYAESLTESYGKIMDHEKHFAFPDDEEASDEAKSLIKRLVCKPENRMGKNGIHELKDHIWFKEVSWKTIHQETPPFVPELSSPSDTRYFDNEDNENKKLPRKTLPKNKEFSGQNLPFVGYTYSQNATPSVSFGRVLKASPSTNQSLSTSAGSSGDVLAERNKRITAEQEFAKLKSLEAASSATIRELKASLLTLQTDNSKLQSELSTAKEEARSHAADRDDLYSRVSGLRRKLEEESSLRAAAEASAEEAKELREALKATQEDLAREQTNILDRSKEMAEARSLKAAYEADIERLKKKLADEQSQRSEFLSKAEEVTRKLEREVKRRQEIDNERGQLADKCESLLSDLTAARKLSNKESEKADKLAFTVYELERTKKTLEIDLESAKRKLDEMTEERRRSRTSASVGELENMKAQLEAAVTLRAKEAGELTIMAKERAMLELELVDLKDSVKTSKAELSKLNNELSNEKSKTRDLQQQLAGVQEKLRDAERVNTNRDAEIRRSTAERSNSQNVLKEAEVQIATLEKSVASCKSELEDARLRLNREQDLFKRAQGRLIEMEKNHSEERKNRISLEAQISSLQLSTSEALRDRDTARTKLVAYCQEQATTNAEYQFTIAKLNADIGDLAGRVSREEKLRQVNESEKASLEARIDGLQRESSRREETIRELESHLADAEVHLAEQETHLHLEIARSKALQDKVAELESNISLLSQQLESQRIIPSKTAESTKTVDNKSIISSETGKSVRLRLKNVFFKGQQQKAEQEKAMQRIAEVEEELRKLPHLRQASASSNGSFVSNHTKMSEFSLAFEFDLLSGLRGNLKIPKSGKVKKGWKNRYGVIRDFKLVLYERDKDMEQQEGIVVADLRNSLFIIKTVTQNELIHASARDIDCIFKIQTVSAQATPKEDLSSMDEETILKQIISLQTELDHEQKMFEATEKMLAACLNENQKSLIVAQLEKSDKMRTKLTLDIGNLKSKISTDIDQVNLETVEAHVAQEEKEHCIKELKIQLANELQKLVSLEKLMDQDVRDKGPGQVEHELQLTENRIHKINDDLIILESNDVEKISWVVRRVLDKNTHGHHFKARQTLKPVDCAYCHEPTWSSELFECHDCKVLCHRHCRQLIDQTCSEIKALRDVKPMYFMADSQVERSRWIAGLEFFRKEATKGHKRENSGRSTPHTPISASMNQIYSSSPSLSSNTTLASGSSSSVANLSSSPLKSSFGFPARTPSSPLSLSSANDLSSTEKTRRKLIPR